MRIVIVILFLTLEGLPNPAESVWPFSRGNRRKAAVHPSPIQLNIQHFESYVFPGQSFRLRTGFWPVATDKNHEYVIGIILGKYLFPLTARRADLDNEYGRVKVRIDGNDADVTAPISRDDPLNRLLFEKFKSKHIRVAQI